MVSDNPIVLVSSRERVTNALRDGGSVACIMGGLGLLASASPMALLVGSSGLLLTTAATAITFNKLEKRLQAFIEPNNIWSKLTDKLGQPNSLQLHITRDDGCLQQRRALGRAITYGSRNYMMLSHSNHPDMEHAVCHEFAHLARGDAKQNTMIMYICGVAMMAGAGISLLTGLAPAVMAAPAMVLGFLSTTPGLKGLFATTNHMFHGALAPAYEREADRIAVSLLDTHLPAGSYCTPQQMAAHCDALEVPRPRTLQHLPATALAPLQQRFNKLCSFICKPVTMKNPALSSPQ